MLILYNRYIPKNTSYQAVDHAHPKTNLSPGKTQRPPPPPTNGANSHEGIPGGLSGLLKNFHLNKLDTGDILLILILLFLALEQDDNLEPIITLGLLLLFGLFGNDEEKPNQPSSSPTM